MRINQLGIGVIVLLLSGIIPTFAAEQVAPDRDAGGWKTWLSPSGKNFRTPPPPDAGTTEKEAAEIGKLAATRDKAALDKIAY